MTVIEVPKRPIESGYLKYPTKVRSSVPLLENGDHLTREEFEYRYDQMPEVKKAELIEGVVHMPSPVYRAHGWAHSQIITWLGVYCAATPGVRLYDNTSVRLDADNEPQPDALLRREADLEQPLADAKEYIETAPELIVEVAASSASYDLYNKKKVYQRNGVQEYVAWQLYENHVDWFLLQAGHYVALTPDEDGILRSREFPGLWLAVDDLLAGNLAQVLTTVQHGVQIDKNQEARV